MKYENYSLNGEIFEYQGKKYDCTLAIRRDKKMILQEAEISHQESFLQTYDKDSLKVEKIRVFFDSNDVPVFGIIVYRIDYKDGSSSRSACGGYYPLSEDFGLLPHPFQESICW